MAKVNPKMEKKKPLPGCSRLSIWEVGELLRKDNVRRLSTSHARESRDEQTRAVETQDITALPTAEEIRQRSCVSRLNQESRT